MTLIRTAALAALLGLPLAVLAQAPEGQDGGPPPGGRPHGPPPEAIAACQGKAVGATASFTDPRGRSVSGPCVQLGDVVAVKPPRHPHGGHDGPPPPQPDGNQ